VSAKPVSEDLSGGSRGDRVETTGHSLGVAHAPSGLLATAGPGQTDPTAHLRQWLRSGLMARPGTDWKLQRLRSVRIARTCGHGGRGGPARRSLAARALPADGSPVRGFGA
jgi:hypothetical protein